MLPRRYSETYNAAVFDWNDLRHFLAVARTGSTLAAARVLKISQPTVVRRIAALEDALGVTLFERRSTGYVPTAAGETLLGKSEQVEHAATAVLDAALAHARDTSGTVTISVFEIFGVTLVAPAVRELQLVHPHIRVDLDFSDEVRDLREGEADIALRSAVRLSGGGLVCRRIGDERWGYFCSRSYAERNGLPRSPDEIRGHAIIGDGSEDFWPAFEQWRRASGIRNTIDFHHGTPSTLLAAVRSGYGLALLPHLAAFDDPELVHCFDGPETGHSLWLVTSDRLRDTPRIRLVMDFLAPRLRNAARRAASIASASS